MPRHPWHVLLAALPIALALLLTGCPLVEPPPSEYPLHVTIVGNGTVTSNPQGIDCPGTCTHDFADGAIIDLTATPAPGHTFGTWTGDPDCSDARVTMTDDRTCVATFQELTGFTAIAGGNGHSLALDHDGRAWAWGDNGYGQLGDGTTGSNRSAPTHVIRPTGTTFTAISGGDYHSLALDQNGDAWGWGGNGVGQIGDGTSQTGRLVPTRANMPADVRFVAISAGDFHSLALDQNGDAWAWGNDDVGQIGDGATGTIRSVPTRVTMPADVTFTAISASGAHSLALDQNGHAWGWGSNDVGQIGDGTEDVARLVPTPVAMPTDLTFTTISGGRAHSLALDQNGHAWAWGYNVYGQIGDGTTGDVRLAPTAVIMPTDSTFTTITGGSHHSLALDQNGQAWGWGDNIVGQVGYGASGGFRWAPTAVDLPAGAGLSAIGGGGMHSLAIDHHGNAWAWGSNDSGQIGDGTSVNDRTVPTAVLMP